ncbi:MAG TPA: hypothetical protein DIW50_03820 [Prolixibacteraceae bacterium]|nr:hypothetical protein [Prolixibacteraceae bacterium]
MLYSPTFQTPFSCKKFLLTKKMKMLPLISLVICIIINSGCKDPEPNPANTGERIIRFSGYDWIVDSSNSTKHGPGPNYFSDSEENVWVDQDGQLHLKITYRNGHWYCSKVIMKKSYGYNKYVFYVASRVDQLDKNVVGGLFTYMNDQEEIDIEFSKWSIDGNKDSQFAIQPTSHSGNKIRYNLNLEGNNSTHFFNWHKNKIEFASFQGHTLNPPADKIIEQWTYTGADIPPDSDERVKINLWLFRGTAPSDNKEVEMIIKGFEIY